MDDIVDIVDKIETIETVEFIDSIEKYLKTLKFHAMKNSIRILAFAAFAANFSAFAQTPQHTPIPYDAAKMSASAIGFYTGGTPSFSRIPTLTLTPTGLTAGTDECSTDATVGWTSQQFFNGVSFPGTWFRVDLGEVRLVNGLKLWNYNMSGFLSRGIKQTDIFVATDPTLAAVVGGSPPNSNGNPNQPDFTDPAWTPVKSNHDFFVATGSGQYNANNNFVPFAPVPARFIGFRIKSIQGTSSEAQGYTGFYKLRFYEMAGLVITVDSLSVTSATSADFGGVMTLYDAGFPAQIVACYGATNAVNEMSAWDNAVNLGTAGDGVYTRSVTGLSADRGYWFAAAATNDTDMAGWSPVRTFITGAVEVEAPADFFKTQTGTITFKRPIGTTNVPLTVTYNVGGTATAGTHYTALPGSVTFAENESVATQTVTPLNVVFGGDKVVTLTLTGSNFLPNLNSAGSFTIRDNESGGGTNMWTGLGYDGDWGNPDNWDPVAVPGPSDTARFTFAPALVELNATRTIYKLLIEAPAGFTIGTADDRTGNFALRLTEIERTGTAAGTHVMGAAVEVVPNSAMRSYWTLGGANALQIGGGLRGGASGVIERTGAAALQFTAGTSYAGTWELKEGATTITTSGVFTGSAIIGGGNVAASLTNPNNNNYGIAGNISITVLTNGVFNGGSHLNSDRVWGIHAKEGGVATVGGYFYCNRLYFTGGQILGGAFTNTRLSESYASGTMALCTSGIPLEQYSGYSWTVARGTAHIDLRMTGNISGNVNTGQNISKLGPGILQLTGYLTATRQWLLVDNGTILFDNTVGSLNNNTPLRIRFGATAGGTGFLGGGGDNGNVSLTDGNATTFPTIAPGTIDHLTGAHIIGTLTVGTVSQTNNVTFNNYSRLSATIGTGGVGDNDCLEIFGRATIGATGTILNITTSPEAKAGAYTLMSAENDVVGTFATVIVNGETTPRLTKRVAYTGHEVIYTIPPSETVVIIR